MNDFDLRYEKYLSEFEAYATAYVERITTTPTKKQSNLIVMVTAVLPMVNGRLKATIK